MESEKPFHQGYLMMPPLGKILLKKSWTQKYCLLFSASKFGIQRLEVYDNQSVQKGDQPRILCLENCIKVYSKAAKYITIITKSTSYEFAAFTHECMQEWLTAFQFVAFPDNASKITSLEEDNDLYCSSGEGVFSVTLHHSPASQRCGLAEDVPYTLILTSVDIQLWDSISNKILYKWPYCYIRRYGYKNGKFTFEAGRKCESGEGIFFLEHPNQREIFRCLATKIKSIKTRLNPDNMTVSSMADHEDPLQVALSMEAKSRSPLPASAISSMASNLHLFENHSFQSSESSESSFTTAKPKPTKPPRKFINQKTDYEPVDRYDDVEYRNDAWRTLGVDEVKHTEQVTTDDEELEYVSWGGIVKEQIKKFQVAPQTKAPKILMQSVPPANGDESYDKLNYFGSSSKLNAKSGYKQVIPAPIVPISPPSFNVYDEISIAVDESEKHLADDSHLGYAMIRKQSPEVVALPLSSKDRIPHQFHNNEPYAVISKPKRV